MTQLLLLFALAQPMIGPVPAMVMPAAPSFAPPPSAGKWAQARCTRQADNSVHCDEVAFTVLIDSLTEAEGTLAGVRLQLTAKDIQLASLRAALLVVPAPAAPPPPKLKPIVAVTTAVLGTAALTTALLTESWAPAARIGLGVTGAAAVVGSFVIIF